MILDFLYEALRDWYPDTMELIKTMTDEERASAEALAARILERGTHRSPEQVLDNVQGGKLAEFAVMRRLRQLGCRVEANNEALTKERHWDLKLWLPGIAEPYLLEIKTQKQRTESVRFTAKDETPVILSHWAKCHAIIVLVPAGEFRPAWAGGGKHFALWCVLDPKVVSAYEPYRKDLDSVPGAQIMIDRLTPAVARITDAPAPGIRG